MKTCSGCGREFDESIPLYPRLILTKEAQVAKKLAESSGKDMLCLICWMEAIQAVDQKDLALLLLGMLDKIRSLTEQLGRSNSDILEKIREAPYHPNHGPIWEWQTPKVYTGDSVPMTVTPWIKHETTYSTGTVSKCSIGTGDVYLSGGWSSMVCR